MVGERRTADFALFDLGGVLVEVDFDRAAARWMEAGLGPPTLTEAFRRAGRAQWERGALSSAELVEGLRGCSRRPLSTEAICEAWCCAVWWRPWVGQLIGRLRVPFGVLSNTDPWHVGALGVLPGATCCVYSFETGAWKPEAAAFEAAIARCGHPAERVRYLDDRPENVEAARALGFQARLTTDRVSVEAALADVC